MAKTHDSTVPSLHIPFRLFHHASHNGSKNLIVLNRIVEELVNALNR
jgi:hypothetical protein